MMMSKVKREMEIISSFFYTCRQYLLMNGKKCALVHLNHQSLRGTVLCGVQLRAANHPLLCLLGKVRIIGILKVMMT